jgi:glycosyltransferase involved in cell wall biosynthesis
MSRRVVVLAYYYPPLAGIASDRAAALSRHLKPLGWEPTVVAPRSGFYHRAPERDEVDVQVVRTRSVELSRLLRAVYSGKRRDGVDARSVRAVETGRFGEHGRRLVRDFVYVPDAQVGWVPFAATAAARAVSSGLGPALIYSSSVPYSAHLAALAAARRSRCAWVAEFRDPWSAGRTCHGSSGRIRPRVNAALERWIVRNADHVVVTAPSLRNDLLAAHEDLSPEIVSVVTNGFEPLPERAVPDASEPMTILYAGTVAAGEDMRPILVAFDQLARRRPATFRLVVLGPREPWQESPPPGDRRPWLSLDGVVTPARAREAMAQSSVLLHVRRQPAARATLPGKLFEYIGARRPIVAVCPPESDMAALLSKHADARLVRPQEPEALVETLEHLIDEHMDGRIQQPRVPASLTAPLRRQVQAAKLAEIFELTMAGQRPATDRERG